MADARNKTFIPTSSMGDVKVSEAAVEKASKIVSLTESKVDVCDICFRELISEPYIACALCTKTVCMKHGIRVLNGPETPQMWCILCYQDDID